MGEFDISSVPSNAAEADQLLNSISEPSVTQDETPSEAEPVVETKATDAQAPTEYEINWRGEAKKLTLEQLINYAQQAYDYNTKMRDFNVQRTTWEKEKQAAEQKWKDYDQRLNQYREVDEYIKQDPAWWNHVQESFRNRGVNSEQGQSASPYVKALEAKLADLEGKMAGTSEFINSEIARREAEKQAAGDEALQKSITDFVSAHPDLDWKSVDDTGRNLESRIIDYANENGIGSFKAAARDLLYDELVKRAAVKAKEETGNEIKAKAKLGLGPITEKPTVKIERAKNVGSKSWNALEQEALEELGLAS